jgi:hypothetical protein
MHAMPEPIKAGPFLGINNKLPSEKLIVPKEGAFVRDAVNVDLTSAGTFQRRAGHNLVQAANRASSLWSDGVTGYYVDGPNIKTFDGTTTRVVATLPSSGASVSFTKTPLGTVWTDGATVQVSDGASSKPLVPPTPNPVPAAMAAPGGGLAAGAYRVAFAHVVDGVRSALTQYQLVNVADGDRIQISQPSGPETTRVFVSAVGGTELYRELDIPPSTAVADVFTITSQGAAAYSIYEAPLPGGVIVRLYRGRLLTVKGNAISYSLPYNYGLHHPAHDFIRLDGDVTLCEPTQSGVFLATANDTWFLDGEDMTKASLRPLAPYGAIPNTVVYEPNSLDMWWSTSRGLVRTTDGNGIEMKQDANIAFSSASGGAALFREENGLTQVISVLSDATPTGAASASSYMDAEVIK